MMRYVSKVPFIALLFLMIDIPLSYADEWVDYLALTNNHYYLDTQSFDEIHCDLDIPFMNNILTQAKQQLQPLGNKIEIKNNLSDFNLTYTSLGGLKLSHPTLDVILKSEEGLANPSQVHNGIATMKKGFDDQVSGVNNILQGLFDDYISPKKNNFQNITISKNSNESVVKYHSGNSEFTSIYNKNTINTTQKSANQLVISKQVYENIPSNKLIISKADIDISSPSVSMKTNLSVKYQQIKSITFPKVVVTNFTSTMQGMNLNGQIEINIKNCSLR